MNSGRFAVRFIVNNVVARRSYGGGKHFSPSTMNHLPVPQGDFFMHDAARHRRFNTVLALGVVMFGSALFAWKESKLINLNYSPPKTYE